MAMDTQTEATANRFRAAKACRRCNQRRVRCDALEHGTPCTRCRRSENSECVLIQSKRGTYARKKAKIGREIQDDHPSDNATVTLARPSLPPRESPSQSPVNRRSSHNGTRPSSIPSDHRSNGSVNRPPSMARDLRATVDAETSPASIPTALTNTDLSSPESNFTETSASSYREISWTAMFDHFLNSRRRERKDIIDKGSITYLGESFPLAIVLEDYQEGGKPLLHHPGPPLEESQPRAEQSSEKGHPSHLLPEDIDFLEAKKSFEYPTDEILSALISTFLDRVFPLYPVVNRQEFLLQYENKSMPWILLHSVCFIAATYCPIATLHRAGFAGRKQARFSYYRKAKALFDTGYESNKIVILQSVILLTFWGGGPNNYWNFYSWIGTGVTIAETLGIHRSLAGTNMSLQDRSLLKRLWWTLVIRDASCGSLVGRPFRINMDNSDTEMLTPEDFEHDAQSPDFAKHPLKHTFGLYQIHMSKLSLILREIVTTRFDPGRRSPTMANMYEMLQNWRQNLPPELSWSEHSTKLNVFTCCLSILFNHHLILAQLGRPTSEAMATISESGSATLQHLPETAAQRISVLASMMVTRAHVLLVPHEAFQGLFLAEVVFYTQMKSPQPMVAQLGRMALNNCQLVLHNAKEAWDPAPWVMQLFDNLIANLKEESPNPEINLLADHFGGDYRTDGSMMGGPGGAANIGNDYDLYQPNPMLSTFFDMSQDAGVFHGSDYSTFSSYLGGIEQPRMMR